MKVCMQFGQHQYYSNVLITVCEVRGCFLFTIRSPHKKSGDKDAGRNRYRSAAFRECVDKFRRLARCQHPRHTAADVPPVNSCTASRPPDTGRTDKPFLPGIGAAHTSLKIKGKYGGSLSVQVPRRENERAKVR